MGVPDKERYIYLYTASEKEKQRYVELAKATGVPLSKFLLSKIEEALAEKPRSRAKELEDLKEKLALLQEDVRLKDQQLRQYKALLERQKALDLLDDSLDGGELNERLIQVLKVNGPIHGARLLEILGVEPSDLEITLAVSKQLEILEAHGRIKKGARGWRWSR